MMISVVERAVETSRDRSSGFPVADFESADNRGGCQAVELSRPLSLERSQRFQLVCE